jgi:hypothetical protein
MESPGGAGTAVMPVPRAIAGALQAVALARHAFHLVPNIIICDQIHTAQRLTAREVRVARASLHEKSFTQAWWRQARCSETANLDRFWLEFSVVIPGVGGAERRIFGLA